MAKPGDVLSYIEMCSEVEVNLQRGMNFRLKGVTSIILMSIRPGAPYADHVEEGGRILVYEGHDVARIAGGPDPKKVDQPEFFSGSRPTQNGLFMAAVRRFKKGEPAELVRVYEKIRAGIWVYNGTFRLIDGWTQPTGRRKVFKFKLELAEDASLYSGQTGVETRDDRVIPSSVKLEVWKRDKGKCVECGSTENLRFDHIIPYSQGGSSRDPKNIQILCARHNLEKHDKIM